MAIIRPFQSVRPAKDYADQIAALPYDVYNRQEAREEVKGKPYSFLRIDRAEVELDENINLYDEKVYEQASKKLNGMIEDGYYIQDEESYLYLYELTMNGRKQTGLVVCTSIDEYLNNNIKKHELTREEKEKDRINHVDYCDANTGPIFLTYKSKEAINQIVDHWTKENNPQYDFTSDDNITHRIWVIDDKEAINQLRTEFEDIDSLYIADGHHRAASAVKVGLKRREQNPNYTGEEEFNYFLSVVFPDEQLYIMDYNRVVKDLNNYSLEEFINKVEEKFTVEKVGTDPYKPTEKATFGMFIEENWYKLTAKEGTFDKNDPVEKLDVSILQNNLLAPILDIGDPRKDNRIDFVGGIRGLKELEKRAHSDMKIGFAMYPTSIEELMDIADADKLMPPKSTWFEPKLRSGLFVHKLK